MTRNVVFIWIPKVAGTSIHAVLRRHHCPLLHSMRAMRARFPARGMVTLGHVDYAEAVRHGYVPRRFDDGAFKFCFVRNPYDRVVSLFFYLKKAGRLTRSLTFLQFCRMLRSHGLPAIGLYNSTGLSQCNPQVRWTERIDLNFVGRYEQLAFDFQTLLVRLDLPRVLLPSLNATPHPDYRQVYCEWSRKIVADLYREDFDVFGYSKQLYVSK